MLQGTASHVGKTVLTAALCRIYARRGLSVAPFKAQNMALNSAVTAAGDEMGRAQVFQAAAAGIEAHVDMNPVLLKPSTRSASQVVVMGRPVGELSVADYHAYQAEVWPLVTAALARLRGAHELVVIEGAGSSAEINLRDSDIVNMRVARHAGAPVLLVGDIDRGGVFAALLGHMELFTAPERALVGGFVVNKFRGNAAHLTPGLELPRGAHRHAYARRRALARGLERRRGGLGGPRRAPPGRTARPLRIAVVRLPFLSNTTDFDALAAEPDVAVEYVDGPGGLSGATAVVLPGTKATVADLAWLRERGIDAALRAAAATGVPVIGICGGYQMLGRRIMDPGAVESAAPQTAGLGLLDVETTFAAAKRTVRASGLTDGGALAPAGAELRGYEIHMGRTRLSPGVRPFARLRAAAGGRAHPDGAVSADGRVCGTYLHGLFDAPAFRAGFLDRLRAAAGLPARPPAAYGSDFERLADHVEANLDLDRLDALIGFAASRFAAPRPRR